MLVPYPGIQGPLPKIVPLLVDSLRRLGCVIHTAPWSRHSDKESLAAKVLGRMADIRRIRRRLRQHRPDVLYVTTAHNWPALLRDVPLLLLSRRLCPTIVLEYHGSLSDLLVRPGHRLLKCASHLVLRETDAVLLLSTQEQHEWQRFRPSGRFEVVRNPYVPDDNDEVEGAPRRQGPRCTSVSTLLYVGRLMEDKGILDLIEALRILLTDLPCRLIIAGDGPLADAIRTTVSAPEFRGAVDLRGYIDGAQLSDAFRESDVFVLPTYHAEGFPTVIMEAMQQGLPVVTTKLRGSADILADEVNALFVPPHEPGTLARVLARLLKDDGLRAEMGRSNREKVREFAPDTVAPHYLDVLLDVARRHVPMDTAPTRMPRS